MTVPDHHFAGTRLERAGYGRVDLTREQPAGFVITPLSGQQLLVGIVDAANPFHIRHDENLRPVRRQCRGPAKKSLSDAFVAVPFGDTIVIISATAGFVWRNTPNAISLLRLLAAPVLVYALMTGRRELFQWLLLACLLSDILDGLIARMFHLSSPLGAFLDSTADMLMAIIAALGLFAFQKEFLLAQHFAPLAVVVTLHIVEMLAALLRYGEDLEFPHAAGSSRSLSTGDFYHVSVPVGLLGGGFLCAWIAITQLLAYSEGIRDGSTRCRSGTARCSRPVLGPAPERTSN